ncbi:hypothetical protein GCM10017567_50430 [Amycolatopsis bullii]|uniref:Uncharacterized protein n=1 Tax=Amycolatopsis bullii TaxID=941987 RepID=A0ABQ3KLW4_9PSEU|nr:hypothetical protein GCM10017567_50430 [Amycolatopsis bullii]
MVADDGGVSEVDGVAEVAGGAEVTGAVAAGGGAWATVEVFCTGPGSNRQTAMNPAMDSATTKMVFFTTIP